MAVGKHPAAVFVIINKNFNNVVTHDSEDTENR